MGNRPHRDEGEGEAGFPGLSFTRFVMMGNQGWLGLSLCHATSSLSAKCDIKFVHEMRHRVCPRNATPSLSTAVWLGQGCVFKTSRNSHVRLLEAESVSGAFKLVHDMQHPICYSCSRQIMV